jgi:hypothetical protein
MSSTYQPVSLQEPHKRGDKFRLTVSILNTDYNVANVKAIENAYKANLDPRFRIDKFTPTKPVWNDATGQSPWTLAIEYTVMEDI